MHRRKQYDLRPNRPRTRDGTFLRLHLHGLPQVDHEIPCKQRITKTRWLKGIAAHLQQSIVRAVADRAKGEKRTGKIPISNYALVQALLNLGINNKWVSSSILVNLLNIDTSVIKGDFLKTSCRLQFRLILKVTHYFNATNAPRKTPPAYFLAFRLLKNAPERIHSS